MKDIQIDEKFINDFIETFDLMLGSLHVAKKQLQSKETDIFIRYLTYFRLKSILGVMTHIKEELDQMFRGGFDMNHEIFKTKEYLEAGWDDIDLERNPFFVQNQKENSSDFRAKHTKIVELNQEDLPEDLASMLLEFVKKNGKVPN